MGEASVVVHGRAAIQLEMGASAERTVELKPNLASARKDQNILHRRPPGTTTGPGKLASFLLYAV
jgi:hypothetical protein